MGPPPIRVASAVARGAGPAVVAAGLPAAVFALGLACVHLFAGRLRFLGVVPRSRWLSISGGAAVAYVFVHLLPEVAQHGEAIERSRLAVTGVDQHVYLVSLAGFVAFYGLERFVRRSATGDGEATSPAGVFALHVGSFAAYNGLVGYLLLHREVPGLGALATFAVAMGLHFLVNDYGLRERHGDAYHRYGRWVLAASVIGGFAVGAVTRIGALTLALLYAFLAGSVVLTVIKEELPEERESRFWAFALGAAGYALVLLGV